jgi:hypothetical protein
MRALMRVGLLVLLARGCEALESASFLDIAVGARALGMGGAYTALADEVHALYWNPAGLSKLERREFSASHAELFENTRHDFLAYAHPTSQGTFAAGLTYLSQGRIAGRDSLGRPTADYDSSDVAVSACYARKLDLAGVGVSFKYIRSSIGSVQARSSAVDLGAQRNLGKLAVGAALRNLGPGLKYDNERNDLPLRLAVGAGYKFAGGHALAVEAIKAPRGVGTEASFGGEYLSARGVCDARRGDRRRGF